MADFLWHKVSDEEKEEIKKQAKGIMDRFSKKLSKIGHRSVSPKALNEGGKVEDVLIEREKGEREEGGKCLEIDRDIMFENAPKKKDKEFIVAEKGGWG